MRKEKSHYPPRRQGGGIVVLDKANYLKEMYRLLSDTDTYSVIPNDPTTIYKKELLHLVNEGFSLGILNKKEKSFLVPLAPRIPTIYYLPKVHKDPVNPPGRPIVSGIDSVTARIGKYVDHYLQPLVRSTTSYLKDTRDTIKLLESTPFKKGMLLATADVAALYTCIPHRLGFEAVESFLSRDSQLPLLQRNFIMQLLRFATRHNYFWFQNQFFLQKRGVAMGAKFAPSLANLFMAQWEEDRQSLDDNMTILNSNDRGISLSYEASSSHVHFLDLEIMAMEDHLEFKTYFKPTDRNGYIPVESCHQEQWLKAIPRGQFLRLRRNCSKTSDFLVQSQLLKKRFLEKGYGLDHLDEEINAVLAVERTATLTERPKNTSDSSFKWAFTTTHSIQSKQVKNILKKHWRVLLNDRLLGPVLPERAPVIFRGARSIQGQIAPNVIDPPKKISFFQDCKGFYPCRKCNVCHHNSAGRQKLLTFTSTVTSRVYHMKEFATCASQYIVYLITCPCHKQYVGRTIRTFSIRVNEHITGIKEGKSKHTVPRHYLQHHNRDPSGTLFQVIDRFVPHWRGESRLRGVSRLETYWIYELRSFFPFGMNVEWDLNSFINTS